MPTPGGSQEALYLREPAVYRLIFRSNKPEAEAFTNWVCEEVLPAIRTQGYFGEVSEKDRLSYSRQIVAVAEKLGATTDALVQKVLLDELRDLCNLIGRTMPDVPLLGTKPKQLPLKGV